MIKNLNPSLRVIFLYLSVDFSLILDSNRGSFSNSTSKKEAKVRKVSGANSKCYRIVRQEYKFYVKGNCFS